MLLFNYAGATIIALLIFLIIYSIRPVLITKSNKYFLVVVIAEVIGVFANIISAYVDNHGPEFYKPLIIIFNNTYYISYIARYFLFTLYFAALLQVNKKRDLFLFLSFLVTSSVTLLILTCPWSEIIYKLSPEQVFSTGDFVILIYVSNVITLLVDIYYFAISLKKLNRKDKIAIILAILILLSCCIIDFMFIDYVISDIFFILEVLILYLMFENPDGYYDKRTNILNFDAFKDFVTNNLFNHKNSSIMCFEINNYSQIKDLYGTKQIDLVLKEIGKYLSGTSAIKISFYLQNGKFAIIKSQSVYKSQVKKQIEERFQQPWQLKNNTEILITIVLMEMEKTVDFQSFSQLESCIEQAGKELKKKSKSEIIINSKILNQVVRKTQILKILKQALDTDNVKVYFQPIVDSKTRKIVAAEALARLYDDELGVISPVEFITLAEENGYIEKLGEQILNKVCIFLSQNNIEKQGIRWINVNLSPIQCQNKNLLENINKIRDEHKVKSHLIHFEITEESMIDKPILKKQINELINNGYKISLDDFGTGFSNFYSIKAFLFSNIKLDMSLVNDHFNNPDNLLPGIVSIFTERNLSVTAEGIETKEMADEFEKIGCDYLQGYYFSKPVTEEQFLEMLGTK